MLLDLKTKKPVGEALFTVPEQHGVDKMRFNDGKAAPGGAVIIGRMHADWRKGSPGRLYKCAFLLWAFVVVHRRLVRCIPVREEASGRLHNS